MLLIFLSACSHGQGRGEPAYVGVGSDSSIDSDDDGIPDSYDNCPQVANRDQSDLNGDGYGDRCDDLDGDRILDYADEWPLDPENDNDRDGFGADPYDNCGYICSRCEQLAELCRQVDNCPYLANDQADADQDGFGDLCDTGIGAEPPACHPNSTPCDTPPLDDARAAEDNDHDKVPDSEDNCLELRNPYDVDTDGDGKADAQLNTDNDAFGDPCDGDDDNDGVLDPDDNCQFVHNSIQDDLDCDGQGDACDNDRDGDGYSDADEIIEYGTSPTNADSDGDGISDGPLIPKCPGMLAAGPDPTPLGDMTMKIVFEIRDASGADITDRWIPLRYPDSPKSSQWWEERSKVDIIARLKDSANPLAVFDNDVTFEIFQIPIDGVAINTKNDPLNDFSFDTTRSGLKTTVPADGGEAATQLYAFDYGGSFTLKATASYSGSPLEATIDLPLDSDHDGLPDAWEKAHPGFDPANPHTFDPAELDSIKDVDKSLDNTNEGDGLTNAAEYRGIVFDPPGSAAYHIRLNPLRKDLFVRGDNFTNSLIKNFKSAAGAVQPFTLDYAVTYNQPAGTLSAFEEAGIDVHDVTGMISFTQTAEPPNIDILVVSNVTERDLTSKMIHTLLGKENGTINHPSIKQPRFWTWDLKGASYIGDAELYAVLRDGSGNPLKQATETYHLCLMHYFYNRPYLEDTDNTSLCNRGYVYKLDALGNVEDFYLENGTDPPDKKGNKNEERCIVDSRNPVLDGDRMSPDWMLPANTYGTNEYELGLKYSAFDADVDGWVENPIVSDPATLQPGQLDPGEYTLQQVQLHTVLHEMGHAVGMDDQHTSDPSCLMYDGSIGWDRAGHFSPAARSQILIHNK